MLGTRSDIRNNPLPRSRRWLRAAAASSASAICGIDESSQIEIVLRVAIQNRGSTMRSV